MIFKILLNVIILCFYDSTGLVKKNKREYPDPVLASISAWIITSHTILIEHPVFTLKSLERSYDNIIPHDNFPHQPPATDVQSYAASRQGGFMLDRSRAKAECLNVA